MKLISIIRLVSTAKFVKYFNIRDGRNNNHPLTRSLPVTFVVPFYDVISFYFLNTHENKFSFAWMTS